MSKAKFTYKHEDFLAKELARRSGQTVEVLRHMASFPVPTVEVEFEDGFVADAFEDELEMQEDEEDEYTSENL